MQWYKRKKGKAAAMQPNQMYTHVLAAIPDSAFYLLIPEIDHDEKILNLSLFRTSEKLPQRKKHSCGYLSMTTTNHPWVYPRGSLLWVAYLPAAVCLALSFHQQT